MKTINSKSYNFLKFVYISFSLMSISLYAINPGKIEGSITDGETFKKVSMVKVELINVVDSTIVKTISSNENGGYAFNDLGYGKYALRLSSMNYQKYMIQDIELTEKTPSLKFGNSNLFPDTKNLQEVNITGGKLTGVMEDDKTIYTLNSKSADIAGSGLEVLRQIPDVTVNYMSNDVKLAGNDKILFMVNDRKVDKNYLLQLNPKLIEKIEVITNPGVKYDSDVNAVINIILRNDILYGLSGRVRTDVPTATTILSRNNASVDFFYKKIRFYAGGNFQVKQFDIESTNTRTTTIEDKISILNQNSSAKSLKKNGGFNYGSDWFINDNNIINFYSSMQPRISNKNVFSGDLYYTSNNISTHKLIQTSPTENSFFNDYSIFYKHKFEKKFHEITFETYYSNRNGINKSEYFEQEFMTDNTLSTNVSNTFLNNNENNNQNINTKTDYTYPFTEKLKLSIGYNAAINKSDNTKTELYSNFIDKLKYNETRQSTYSNIAWNVGDFTFQSGIRGEYSNIEIDHGTLDKRNYMSILPFVSTQYKIGKSHTFRLNYRKTTTRPSIGQLSPMNSPENPYSQSAGNLNLKPDDVHQFQFEHRIQIFGPMQVTYRPFFKIINNGILQVNEMTTDSITRKKYNNVSSDLEYGIALSGTIAFVKWWTISPSFTYFRHEMGALPQYQILSQKHEQWRANINSQFILPKEWVIFIESNYSSPLISLQTKSEENYEFVTGFYKAFNKKFNITAVTINPWSTRYITSKSVTNSVNSIQNSETKINYSYLFILRLGYNFNYGKIGKRLDYNRESNDNVESKSGFL